MKKIKSIICCLLLLVCCTVFLSGANGMKISAEGGRTFTESDFVVKGADYELVEDTYSGAGNGIKMTFTSNKGGIHFIMDELQGYEVGSEVIVEFRMYVHQSGYNGSFSLRKAGEELIDYGFRGKTWNRVRFTTKVFLKDGVKSVYVDMINGKGKSYTISDLTVVDAPEKEPLLGGVKLFQLDPMSNLMQSYVIQTVDGKVIVMDGGDRADANNLLAFVRTLSNEVDHWFISHYHSDHIRALTTILEYNPTIKIKNLYYDFPTSEQAKANSGGDGDSYLCDDLDELVEANPDVVENVITPKRGDTIVVDESVTVKVLNDAYLEKQGNYGNNTTVVYKVETPGEDILFLGDLGDRGDAYLLDEWFVEEAEACTIIQLAHHGQNGTTDKFYEMIKEKKVVLYAAKQWIYDNDGGTGFNTANLTTLHMRDLVREWGVMEIYTQARGKTLIE